MAWPPTLTRPRRPVPSTVRTLPGGVIGAYSCGLPKDQDRTTPLLLSSHAGSPSAPSRPPITSVAVPSAERVATCVSSAAPPVIRNATTPSLPQPSATTWSSTSLTRRRKSPAPASYTVRPASAATRSAPGDRASRVTGSGSSADHSGGAPNAAASSGCASASSRPCWLRTSHTSRYGSCGVPEPGCHRVSTDAITPDRSSGQPTSASMAKASSFPPSQRRSASATCLAAGWFGPRAATGSGVISSAT